jgi:hypothetical protein
MDRDAAGTERDVLIPEGSAERIVEISPVEVVERRAPASNTGVTEGNTAKEGTGLPITRIQRERSDTSGAERIGETQPMQNPDGIGADGDPRTNFAEHAALFVDVNLKACAAQGQSSRQTADAGANNEDAHSGS